MMAAFNLTSPTLGVLPLIPALAGVLPVILAAIGGAIISLLKPSTLKAIAKIIWRNKFVLVAVAAAIYGLVQAKDYVVERIGRGSGAAMSADADWAAFRGGPDRRGASLDGEDPVMGGPVWTFSRDFKTYYASPALVGDSIFISSADMGVFKDQGAIYRLNADTGDVIWRYMPKGFRATFSSPSYWERPATNGLPAKAYVVCGEGTHFTADARIVCLDAESGRELWTVSTTNHVESSPAIADGKAYVGAGEDGFYCVDLELGPDGKPNVRFHLPQAQYPDCEASPAVSDGKVYLCLGLGGMAVVCVDGDTGEEIWRTKAPYPVFGPPTIVGDRVFVGMGNGNFVESAEQVRIKELDRLKARKNPPASEEEIRLADEQLSKVNGEIWCLDKNTGELVWSNTVGRVILGAIAHADGFLYTGSTDGALSCFDVDGNFVMSWNAHEPIKTSPAVTENHVYFMTDSGRLYALDRKDFRKPVWQTRIGSPGGLFISSPVVGRGHVFVGTDGSGFMAVGQPAGQEQLVRWPGYLGGAGNSGWADRTPPAAGGRFDWRFPADVEGAEEQKPTSLTVPVALGSNTLYLAQSGDRKGLQKLTLAEDRRTLPSETGFAETANGVYLSAATWDKAVYVVDGKAGDSGRKLRALTADSLASQWEYDVASNSSGEFVLVDGDSLLIYSQEDALEMLGVGSRAALRWRTPVAHPVGAPVLAKGLVFAVSADEGKLLALSASNGAILWSADVVSPTTGAVTDGELVVVSTEAGLAAFDIVSGASAWTLEGEVSSTPLVINGEWISFVSVAGSLEIVNWSGGKVASVTDAVPGVSPLLAGDSAIFFGKNAIRKFDASSKRAGVWLARTGWLGTASAPGVLHEGVLYYGSDSKGLICVGPR